jgi:ornithine cyclodeaminase
MIRYLDVAAVTALVRRIGIEKFVTELAGFVEKDYLRWNEFEKMKRPTFYSPLGVNQLMPIADSRLYSFKYINDNPKNVKKGLMTVASFGMLADVDTGYPLLISDMTLMTAFRTGVTSALAAKYLARKNSKIMAIIGTGSQSEFQAMAFKTLLGISEIRIYDTDPAAMKKFIRNLFPYNNSVKIIEAASVLDAVRGVDIITTATAVKEHASIITSDMIEPGMHINGIGGDCPGKTELPPDVLCQGRVVVEYEPQTRIEGDIQRMPEDFPVTELWSIMTGLQPGRRDDKEVTIFDNVGFALQDFSALRFLYEQIKDREDAVKLDLLPSLKDPKDLFQLINATS